MIFPVISGLWLRLEKDFLKYSLSLASQIQTLLTNINKKATRQKDFLIETIYQTGSRQGPKIGNLGHYAAIHRNRIT